MQTKKLIQCHNLTRTELKEIQRANAVGEAPEMISANIKPSVKIKAYEKHLVHAELEKKEFDRETGARKSVPFVQSFYPLEFERMVKNNLFFGLSVEKVHDPKKESAEPVKTDSSEKTLDQMNKAELTAKYTDLFGEAPAAALKKDELISEINERIEFLNQEQNQ